MQLYINYVVVISLLGQKKDYHMLGVKQLCKEENHEYSYYTQKS